MRIPHLSRPGDMRQRIELQSLTVEKSAAGGMVKSWATSLTASASMRHLSGNERGNTQAAGGEVPAARTVILMRWRSGVTAQMRVLHNGEVYDIKHVNNWEERNKWLLLTCERGVSNG